MSKNKAFTLVEMIITITLIVILSAISVPIYRGYTRNAKMSEGYILIGAIKNAQLAYYNKYRSFLRWNNGSATNYGTCNEEVLGIDARGNKFFTYFIISNTGNMNNNYTMFDVWVEKPQELRKDGTKHLHLMYDIKGGQYIKEETWA